MCHPSPCKVIEWNSYSIIRTAFSKKPCQCVGACVHVCACAYKCMRVHTHTHTHNTHTHNTHRQQTCNQMSSFALHTIGVVCISNTKWPWDREPCARWLCGITIQILHAGCNSFLFGSSVRNMVGYFTGGQFVLMNTATPQRIESWWSRLRVFKTTWWIDLFKVH